MERTASTASSCSPHPPWISALRSSRSVASPLHGVSSVPPALAAITRAHPAQPPEDEPAAVVIDGSQNPELFPEWFIWDLTFHWLSGSNPNSRMPLQQELEVSTAELKLLMANAKAFQQMRTVFENQVRETTNALAAQGMSEGEMRHATWELVLDHRRKLLALRQILYEQLSQESMSSLRAGIARRLGGTKVHLRAVAFEFFRLPW